LFCPKPIGSEPPLLLLLLAISWRNCAKPWRSIPWPFLFWLFLFWLFLLGLFGQVV